MLTKVIKIRMKLADSESIYACAYLNHNYFRALMLPCKFDTVGNIVYTFKMVFQKVKQMTNTVKL